MKNSIVGKTLIILSSVIIVLFVLVAYLFIQSDNILIEKIRIYNYNNTMKTLDDMKMQQLQESKQNIQTTISSIAKNSSIFVYNYDKDGLENSIKNFMKKDGLKCIEIWEGSTNKLFLSVLKNDKQIIISKISPKESIKYQKLHESMFVNESNSKLYIGKVVVYYDEAIIRNRIKALKDKVTNDIKQFNLSIDKERKSSDIRKIYISIIFFILILVCIAYLINMFVNKPLIKFKKGINSFFDYLANPENKVEKIDINSDDEFGQMTKSINQSILLSTKMHGEMAQLLMTMDKNVITTETDDKGIITYVSQAFCDVSGYNKEELIGKPHNIVNNPEMPKEIFKKMWAALKNNETWEGEIKNLKKDDTFYWVYTIISQKCTASGTNCGYTAISYDITDKKVVEDLTSNLELKIQDRTKDLEEAKKEVEAIHKHTRDAIEYAALIQGAVLPDYKLLSNYFQDYFVHWMPKDTVGGDIWLFNELRHKDECLLFFIDCTGHGVPGAFVTMIVKAVEREIVGKILEDPDMEVSPAWVMSYFNRTIKTLLKQETKDSISNAGFDGGIIYYNKANQILKFSGAKTPLFYIDEHQDLKTIKGNNYSVGYKKCDTDYEYKETIIEVKEGMKFYCTTDGFLDQNGGMKDFPFGKKRFENIIKENYQESMAEIQTIFMRKMMEYESMIPNNDRNDDMTVIAFEIGAKSDTFQHTEILKYDGVITQNVVATSMDNIEAKISNMGLISKISTLTIELLQNMMNYSKDEKVGTRDIIPAGFIEIIQTNKKAYKSISKNIISINDKEKIEPILTEIQSLDESAIKKKYRELRRSGENTHKKGGGIGFYEIAKLCSSIDFEFTAINEDKYYFIMKLMVKGKE